MRSTITAAFLLLLAACAPSAPAPEVDALSLPPAPAALAQADWPLPSPIGAAQPDLIVAPDGRVLLSWIEPQGKRHALKFASFNSKQWSEPRTIATGNNWFVNWADTPHIAATADGALWTHWLQKSAAGTYTYDVALSRSADAGATWSKPILVNDDGKAAEHGFVALWPASQNQVGIAWLDGRNSASEGHDAHGHGGGMMTLRTAMFDDALARHNERELDASTCDCCQTDIAATARGPLLAYRDRTAGEIRDIYVSRLDGVQWTSPSRVHADDWKMPACPVNGPSVAAHGENAVVAWYTAAGGAVAVKLAHSANAGDVFGAPVELDRGEAVQGRVEVALDAQQAWLLWLREDAQGQSLWLARYAPDLSRELQRIEVAKLQGKGRGTGFPQLALREGVAHVVWTDVINGKPQLRGARLVAH